MVVEKVGGDLAGYAVFYVASKRNGDRYIDASNGIATHKQMVRFGCYNEDKKSSTITVINTSIAPNLKSGARSIVNHGDNQEFRSGVLYKAYGHIFICGNLSKKVLTSTNRGQAKVKPIIKDVKKEQPSAGQSSFEKASLKPKKQGSFVPAGASATRGLEPKVAVAPRLQAQAPAPRLAPTKHFSVKFLPQSECNHSSRADIICGDLLLNNKLIEDLHFETRNENAYKSFCERTLENLREKGPVTGSCPLPPKKIKKAACEDPREFTNQTTGKKYHVTTCDNKYVKKVGSDINISALILKCTQPSGKLDIFITSVHNFAKDILDGKSIAKKKSVVKREASKPATDPSVDHNVNILYSGCAVDNQSVKTMISLEPFYGLNILREQACSLTKKRMKFVFYGDTTLQMMHSAKVLDKKKGLYTLWDDAIAVCGDTDVNKVVCKNEKISNKIKVAIGCGLTDKKVNEKSIKDISKQAPPITKKGKKTCSDVGLTEAGNRCRCESTGRFWNLSEIQSETITCPAGKQKRNIAKTPQKVPPTKLITEKICNNDAVYSYIDKWWYFDKNRCGCQDSDSTTSRSRWNFNGYTCKNTIIQEKDVSENKKASITRET